MISSSDQRKTNRAGLLNELPSFLHGVKTWLHLPPFLPPTLTMRA